MLAISRRLFTLAEIDLFLLLDSPNPYGYEHNITIAYRRKIKSDSIKMTTNTPENSVNFTLPWEVFKPYLSYLVMFLGMGLISGSIIHAAQPEMRQYAFTLMAIGAVLFSLGSYLNEVLFKTGVMGDNLVKYVLLSLLLAVGIGMVSGSTQHFFDTPIFASYIAPLGIFISSIAFAIRQGYILHRKNWVFMIVLGLAFASVFHLVLLTYAKTLPISESHHGNAAEVLSEGAHNDEHAAEGLAGHNTTNTSAISSQDVSNQTSEAVTEEQTIAVPSAHTYGDGHAHKN
jgi:hypothetical protein